MDLTVPKVAATHTPALTDFKDYLESVTKEDALDSIKNLAQMESEDWFRIGMVLSSFQKTKGEEEFKSLLLYAEQNFQINPRKAYYLIKFHDYCTTDLRTLLPETTEYNSAIEQLSH